MDNNLTYKNSGVDIKKAEKLVDFIKSSKKISKKNSNILPCIGGFASLFSLQGLGYKDPVIASSTDGVGTKILIAIESGIYDFIGIDLVAMCVNDLLCHGADPLFFLDYYATGKLDLETGEKILKSIIRGCEIANIELVGGETAEMPGLYKEKECDLAGFAVGVVERDEILPKRDIKSQDLLVGIKSSGLHSNGFSLVHSVFKKLKIGYKDKSIFGQKSWSEVLMEPTNIYCNQVQKIKRLAKGFAHITGGGIFDNLKRIIPKNLEIDLNYQSWPELFTWIMQEGNVQKSEMLKTFNCGIGMIAVIDKKNWYQMSKLLGESSLVIGSLK